MSHITAKQFAEKYPEFLARKNKSQTFSQQFSSLFTDDSGGPAPRGSITAAQADAFAQAAEEANCVTLECDTSDGSEIKFTGTLAGGTVAEFVAGQVKWGYFISSASGAYFAFADTALGVPGAATFGLIAGFVAAFANWRQAKGAITRMLTFPEGTASETVLHAVKVVSAIYFGAVVGGGLMPTALSGQIEAMLAAFSPTLPARAWPTETKMLLNFILAPGVFGFSGFMGWSTGELLGKMRRLVGTGGVERKLEDVFPTLALPDQADMLVRYQREDAGVAWKQKPGLGGDDLFYGLVAVLLGILCTSTSVTMVKDGLFWLANVWEWALPALTFGEFTMPFLGVLASPLSILPVVGIMAAYLSYVRQGGAAFMDMLRDTFSSRLPVSLRALCFGGSVFGDICTLVVSLLGVIAIGGNATMLGTIAFGAGLANHIMVGQVVAEYMTQMHYGLDKEKLAQEVSKIAEQMILIHLAESEIKQISSQTTLSADDQAQLRVLHHNKASALFALEGLEEDFAVPTVLKTTAIAALLAERFDCRQTRGDAGTHVSSSEVESKSGAAAPPAQAEPKIRVKPIKTTHSCSWLSEFLHSALGGCCRRRGKVEMQQQAVSIA